MLSPRISVSTIPGAISVTLMPWPCSSMRRPRANADSACVAAPPFHHRPRHPMRDPERGEHIGAEHCFAIRVGHIKERGVFEYAGIVDEKVDVARGARQFVDETAIIQIAGDGLHSTAALLLERVELRPAAAGCQDFGAGLRKRNGGGTADAGTRSGDQHCFSGQRHARFVPHKSRLYMT